MDIAGSTPVSRSIKPCGLSRLESPGFCGSVGRLRVVLEPPFLGSLLVPIGGEGDQLERPAEFQRRLRTVLRILLEARQDNPLEFRRQRHFRPPSRRRRRLPDVFFDDLCQGGAVEDLVSCHEPVRHAPQARRCRCASPRSGSRGPSPATCNPESRRSPDPP